MDAFEDRGLFWSSESAGALERMIPPTAAPGTIHISEDGTIELDLDTALDLGAYPINELGQARLAAGILIYGRLKKQGRTIVLGGAFRNGHYLSSNFPAHEKFACEFAVKNYFGSEPLPAEVLIREVSVSLEGFEDWISSRAIDVVMGSDGSYTAHYESEPDLVFDLPDGVMKVSFSIPTAYEGKGNVAELRHQVSINMTFAVCISPQAASIFWGQLRDFILLMTDAEKTLKQPIVKLNERRYWCEFYSYDLQGGEQVPTDLECAMRFNDVKNLFGPLFEKWRAAREKHGPGVYLYFGIRRGYRLFVEHRFANMLWGLERLHRSKFPPETNQPLVNKVNRITSAVSRPKDRAWAQEILLKAAEPSLSLRLYQLFSTLPFSFDTARLRKFCEDLAAKRNDVSHFGGPRTGVDQQIYISTMHEISGSVRVLYHAVLLQEIGTPQDVIRGWLETRWISWRAQRMFESSGLIEIRTARLPPTS